MAPSFAARSIRCGWTESVDIATWSARSPIRRPIPGRAWSRPWSAWRPEGGIGRCLYFSRVNVPGGPGPLLHHIGLYAYRRAALARFVALPPSTLELREKLEQLRALEAGMRIDAAEVATEPLGVDTPKDLEQARRILAPPNPMERT